MLLLVRVGHVLAAPRREKCQEVGFVQIDGRIRNGAFCLLQQQRLLLFKSNLKGGLVFRQTTLFLGSLLVIIKECFVSENEAVDVVLETALRHHSNMSAVPSFQWKKWRSLFKRSVVFASPVNFQCQFVSRGNPLEVLPGLMGWQLRM